MIGIRTSLRIEVLQELHAGNMQYELWRTQTAVRLAHPESLSIVTGVAPAVSWRSRHVRTDPREAAILSAKIGGVVIKPSVLRSPLH